MITRWNDDTGMVSTHASAREATRQIVLQNALDQVSTHASAREAT